MSYDLCYYRAASEQDEPPETIYQRLCEDEEPDGLAWLSVAEIKERFTAAFPTIQDGGTELSWEGEDGGFQIGWAVGSKPQHTLGLLVNCSWSLVDQPQVIEKITAVARSLGCGLFDPQSGKWSK